MESYLCRALKPFVSPAAVLCCPRTGVLNYSEAVEPPPVCEASQRPDSSVAGSK